MTRPAPATDPAEPARPHRFNVTTQCVIDRPREQVWAEYAERHHPAWADQPEGHGPFRTVGDKHGLAVGAAKVAIPHTPAGQGVPSVHYTEVLAVETGYLAEHRTLITGAFDATETTQLLDHPTGGTLVKVTLWVNTVPTSQGRADRLQHNLGRLQQGYLDRARDWQPGTPHRPNIITPEPDDLP